MVRSLVLIHRRPHPEEHRAAMRLEGWATRMLWPTLRDAVLRTAPQGEVRAVAAVQANDGHGAIKVALKSLTLVRVGPVTRLSPSISKKPCPSLSSSIALGSRLFLSARLSESGAKTAPAMSSAPSTPSVSAAR